eukprot:ANDGO_06309.mRNA.1 hypothetical protein
MWSISPILCITLCALLLTIHASAVPLSPDSPRTQESLQCSSEAIDYRLSDLGPNTFYEVRVSYPASNPATFQLMFDTEVSATRSLLDIEKVMFKTDADSRIIGRAPNANGEYILHVSCVREVPAKSEAISGKPVVFNIVLESLILNVPFDVAKIGFVGFFAILFIYAAVIPYCNSRHTEFGKVWDKDSRDRD